MHNKKWPTDEEAEERDAEAWIERTRHLGNPVKLPPRLIRAVLGRKIPPEIEDVNW